MTIDRTARPLEKRPMPTQLDDDQVRVALTSRWGLASAEVEPHHGGMNSATWFVTLGTRRWVAKSVAPHNGPAFAAGLAVAARLDASGIPSGRPEPALDGRIVVQIDGFPLALLDWVPGAPVAGDGPEDQDVIGATLGRVHSALKGADVPGSERFHWVDPTAAHLDVRPWVREHVAAAVAAFDALGAQTLTYGLLHGDPNPEAFRLDPATGVCGLIDWPSAINGPLLYDLASAVMYVGGTDRAGLLIAAYLAQGALSESEVERGLGVLLWFRWAVQADYFARRLVERDLTGIADDAGNEKGLNDAHYWLTSGLLP
jgi:homoserine kinase type II